MNELKFYRCSSCGKVVLELLPTDSPLMCCGKEMEELKPNTVDAAVEKHVPVVTREDGKIKAHVGSVDHPMTSAHWIVFIALQTENGLRIATLDPTDAPEVEFLANEKVIAVYEYCNLHGLWKVAI